MRESAAGALRLRRHLLTSMAAGRAMQEIPAVGEASWRLFLAVERCARPVREVAVIRPPEVLREVAAQETAAILAARAQISSLAVAAAESGLRLLLLKGAAELIKDGPSVTLSDIDVLVTEEELLPARALLASLGYVSRGHGTGFRHDPTYLMLGGIPLELHTSIDKHGAAPDRGLLASAEPLPDLPGLYGLAPMEHAWHILVHSTRHHLHLRGRIRDLLLLTGVLRRLSKTARKGLHERAEISHRPVAMLGHLAMADALAIGKAPLDPFEAEAAALYLTYRWLNDHRVAAHLLLPTIADASAAMLGDGQDLRGLWDEIRRFPEGSSSYAGVAGLERVSLGAGRMVRLLGRLLRTTIATLSAFLVRPFARRLARAN